MYVHSMLNHQWVNHNDSIKQHETRSIDNKNVKTNHYYNIIVLFSMYVSKNLK
jgi:hypothetical protein